MMHLLPFFSGQAELVEASSFLFSAPLEEKQPFDKLRANGFGGGEAR
ncbi:hypothetical protein FHS31_003211 [Sphingomonas vulcanisoli]|uniref:Uncharacterized protein n=1 Tax=Sphingomonas vulcanisoli TaxID=1658060 RepID=A0ABX0TZC9_9SPHN|nr:hypothetical protein [Sphingomonas vulcanisoli]NIJ09574.1 hypothetical protein [Sphingomonas vulcanisoli]